MRRPVSSFFVRRDEVTGEILKSCELSRFSSLDSCLNYPFNPIDYQSNNQNNSSHVDLSTCLPLSDRDSNVVLFQILSILVALSSSILATLFAMKLLRLSSSNSWRLPSGELATFAALGLLASTSLALSSMNLNTLHWDETLYWNHLHTVLVKACLLSISTEFTKNSAHLVRALLAADENAIQGDLASTSDSCQATMFSIHFAVIWLGALALHALWIVLPLWRGLLENIGLLVVAAFLVVMALELKYLNVTLQMDLDDETFDYYITVAVKLNRIMQVMLLLAALCVTYVVAVFIATAKSNLQTFYMLRGFVFEPVMAIVSLSLVAALCMGALDHSDALTQRQENQILKTVQRTSMPDFLAPPVAKVAAGATGSSSGVLLKKLKSFTTPTLAEKSMKFSRSGSKSAKRIAPLPPGPDLVAVDVGDDDDEKEARPVITKRSSSGKRGSTELDGKGSRTSDRKSGGRTSLTGGETRKRTSVDEVAREHRSSLLRGSTNSIKVGEARKSVFQAVTIPKENDEEMVNEKKRNAKRNLAILSASLCYGVSLFFSALAMIVIDLQIVEWIALSGLLCTALLSAVALLSMADASRDQELEAATTYAALKLISRDGGGKCLRMRIWLETLFPFIVEYCHLSALAFLEEFNWDPPSIMGWLPKIFLPVFDLPQLNWVTVLLYTVLALLNMATRVMYLPRPVLRGIIMASTFCYDVAAMTAYSIVLSSMTCQEVLATNDLSGTCTYTMRLLPSVQCNGESLHRSIVLVLIWVYCLMIFVFALTYSVYVHNRAAKPISRQIPFADGINVTVSFFVVVAHRLLPIEAKWKGIITIIACSVLLANLIRSQSSLGAYSAIINSARAASYAHALFTNICAMVTLIPGLSNWVPWGVYLGGSLPVIIIVYLLNLIPARRHDLTAVVEAALAHSPDTILEKLKNNTQSMALAFSSRADVQENVCTALGLRGGLGIATVESDDNSDELNKALWVCRIASREVVGLEAMHRLHIDTTILDWVDDVSKTEACHCAVQAAVRVCSRGHFYRKQMQDAGGLMRAVRLWNLVTYDLTMEGGVNIKNARDLQRNAARLLAALKVPARDYAICLLIPQTSESSIQFGDFNTNTVHLLSTIQDANTVSDKKMVRRFTLSTADGRRPTLNSVSPLLAQKALRASKPYLLICFCTPVQRDFLDGIVDAVILPDMGDPYSRTTSHDDLSSLLPSNVEAKEMGGLEAVKESLRRDSAAFAANPSLLMKRNSIRGSASVAKPNASPATTDTSLTRRGSMAEMIEAASRTESDIKSGPFTSRKATRGAFNARQKRGSLEMEAQDAEKLRTDLVSLGGGDPATLAPASIIRRPPELPVVSKAFEAVKPAPLTSSLRHVISSPWVAAVSRIVDSYVPKDVPVLIGISTTRSTGAKGRAHDVADLQELTVAVDVATKRTGPMVIVHNRAKGERLQELCKGAMPEGLPGEAVGICIERLEVLGSEMVRRTTDTQRILSTVGIKGGDAISKAAAKAALKADSVQPSATEGRRGSVAAQAMLMARKLTAPTILNPTAHPEHGGLRRGSTARTLDIPEPMGAPTTTGMHKAVSQSVMITKGKMSKAPSFRTPQNTSSKSSSSREATSETAGKRTDRPTRKPSFVQRLFSKEIRAKEVEDEDGDEVLEEEDSFGSTR